jgi:hypothetical protein
MSTSSNQLPANEKSGKLLILGVLVIGLAGAAASWWFRYSATHRAAQFWGPQAATLIRDAPHVTLRSDTPSKDSQGKNAADVPRDVSSAKGFTHLRDALLLDASYDWTAAGPPDTDWSNSLVFAATEGAEPRAVIMFSPDFNWAANGAAGDPAQHAVSTSPITKGLREFFAEQAQDSATER